MGCALGVDGQANSRQDPAKFTQRARTSRRNLKIDARSATGPDKMLENVTIIESADYNCIDELKTTQVLKSHFFFYGMTNAQRSEIIAKMLPCRAEAGTYVFKQGDPASSFFIIDQGKVEIQINGKTTSTLTAGDYFGELGLIYMAPRSASIKVVQPTTFWCITRTTFRFCMEEIAKRSYTLAKSFIKNVSLLGFISEKQKDSLAYNMLSLKYEDREVVYKRGDDANAFYIVTEGLVEVNNGKTKTTYKVGEHFGEEALEDGCLRETTAVSQGKSMCLSIGRDVVKNVLGDKISNLLLYNTMKHAVEGSKVLSKLSRVEIEKLLQSCRIKSFDQGQVVFHKGDEPHFVAICLEGKLNGRKDRQLVGEEYLMQNHPPKITADITKQGTGLVGIITFEEITKVTKLRMSEIHRIQHETRYEKRMQTIRIPEPHKGLLLQNLRVVKKLGEGQFGKVYLVRQSSTGALYALKCIDKNEVVKNSMERIIQEEKHILSLVDCPMMVNFVKSFKDDHFIYFLMDYILGSELFDVIREVQVLPRLAPRFYISSLLIAIEYLHMQNIIYRDLKPQNVMVENDGYLKLIDMGTAKQLSEGKGFRTFTAIGTPHYMAPEVLLYKGYTFAADLWSLGVILYELVCKELPYGQHLDDAFDIHNEILRSSGLKYPSGFKDDKTKRLIEQLMNRVPELRLPKGFAALKASPYFDGFNWQDLYDHTMKSPYRPIKQVPAATYTEKDTLSLKEALSKDIHSAYNKKSSMDDWDQQF